MRQLSHAKFPMLAVVAVAAMFVIRVPVTQTWQGRADATSVQQPAKKVAQPSTSESPDLDQVAVADPQPDSEAQPAQTDLDANDQQQLADTNWFDLLTQFQPRDRNDGFPENDASQDSTADTIQNDGSPGLVEDLDDLDLRFVIQLGPDDDDPQLIPSDDDEEEEDDRVLRLYNPAKNGGVVYFVIDQDTYSIDAGQTLELTGKDQWVVMFHRGGNFGNSRSTLKPGSYSFSVNKEGWSLGGG
jgi:hypothetical protein